MISRDQNIDKAKYILENFDRAMEEEWIEVYYQPLVRTSNGRVCSEEALVRWNDPVFGMLNPEDFIAILEAVNAVHRLDLFVLEKVLDKMTRQKNEGLYLVPTSINVSTMDFYSCDIVEEIRRRIIASVIPLNMIAVSIAESATARNNEHIYEQLTRLTRYGIQIWMDDYGGGDSSPILLQKIHFDLLKINHGLIAQIRFSETSRIIITELVRVAMALGIETAAEGVEDEDQVNFLKEIGCGKLQGFYYCKPLPMEVIFDRYRAGKQIGFENPKEVDYFTEVGKISLYDLSFTRTEDNQLSNYFDIMPMAIVEVDDNRVRMVRGNRNFRKFLDTTFPQHKGRVGYEFNENYHGAGFYTMNEIRQCGIDGNKRIIDDRTDSGKTVQILMQRVAVNDISGYAAIALAVLSISDASASNDTLTYNYIARALSEDYVQLYFLNLKTDEYVQYKSDGLNRDVTVNNHGDNFFGRASDVERNMVYKDDLELFRTSMTKENVVEQIEAHGSFSLTYRAMIGGKPTYVSLKAVRVRADDEHIIIGVSNVDAQMRQQEALERIKEERKTYARISALSGDFICIYTVDPETDHYKLYKTTYSYQNLRIESEGDNFYRDSRKNSKGAVYSDDYEEFLEVFTKENVLKQIENNGFFIHTYRLNLDGNPTYISLKGAMLEEMDGPRLLFGIINVDKQIRKDLEYEKNLLEAEKEATIDDLTGVKNKKAYTDLEEKLNKKIAKGKVEEFAVIMCDLNGLKHVNDTLGHQAGDEFIIKGCEIICNAFAHSPVYRVGGDEFIIVAKGIDLGVIEKRLDIIRQQNEKNKETGEVTIAVGFSTYKEGDKSVSDVFDRADFDMYKNKKIMKNA